MQLKSMPTKKKRKEKEDVNVAIFPISFQQRIWDQFFFKETRRGGILQATTRGRRKINVNNRSKPWHIPTTVGHTWERTQKTLYAKHYAKMILSNIPIITCILRCTKESGIEYEKPKSVLTVKRSEQYGLSCNLMSKHHFITRIFTSTHHKD